jgi:hypothetical protein
MPTKHASPHANGPGLARPGLNGLEEKTAPGTFNASNNLCALCDLLFQRISSSEQKIAKAQRR